MRLKIPNFTETSLGLVLTEISLSLGHSEGLLSVDLTDEGGLFTVSLPIP